MQMVQKNNLPFTKYNYRDITYLQTSKKRSLRRLRSLGGALRRHFTTIKEDTKKKVHYSAIMIL